MARKITLGHITLAWHARNQQWRKSIGFKPDKTGTRRVPAEWYFGPEESAAVLAATEKLRAWHALAADWDERCHLAAMLFPNMSIAAPFWLPGAEDSAVGEAQKTAAAEELNRPGVVNIAQAKARFIAAMRARLTLMGPKGLKQSSFNTIVAGLDRAILATTDAGRPIFPEDKLIHLIHYADVAGAINFHYQKGRIAERTAMNYCRVLQLFLNWMDNQPDLRFQKPKGMDALFKLGRPATDPKVPTFAEIRKLYAACADDDERLYVLLGINCGMYEADISALTPVDLIQQRGESYLWWRRAKTSHQNTFHTLHWLFPETAKLLAAQRSGPNAFGRLLLNKKGKPLSEDKEAYRTKTISDLFEPLVTRAKLKGQGISFKSLRKFGAHQVRVQVESDKDNMARMYLGQAIPGVLRNYVRDDFAPLTAELRRLRERLMAEKIWGRSRRGSPAA